MFKNTAAKFMVFAFDTTNATAKTGDAANITCYVSKDYGTVTVLADTSATEMDATNAKGYYLFDAAQGETNGDCLMISAKSSTANIAVIGAPAVIYTRPTTNWLAPTVLNRTLDVASTGEAGLDFDNINSTSTVTLNALTVTGALTVSNGIAVTCSTSNRSAITATGNGTGSGIIATSGSGATGDGIQATSAAMNGNGVALLANGTGNALKASSISGDAILTSVSTSGHGFTAAGSGTTKHGINATGGATSSDGIRATGGGTGHGVNAQSGSGVTGDGILAKSNATAGNGVTMTHNGSGVNDLNATTTPLTLAKTTNITGFNDIAATAIVSSGAITTSSGAVSTVTTVTNQLTAGQIATGVWQDTAAGDFTAANSIGKSVMNGVALGTGLKIAECVLADTLTTYTGNTPQTGDSYVRLGAPAGASVSADVAAVKTDTAAVKLQTDKMAFTVANQIDANIQYVNDVQVNGIGTSGSPWGP